MECRIFRCHTFLRAHTHTHTRSTRCSLARFLRSFDSFRSIKVAQKGKCCLENRITIEQNIPNLLRIFQCYCLWSAIFCLAFVCVFGRERALSQTHESTGTHIVCASHFNGMHFSLEICQKYFCTIFFVCCFFLCFR